MVFCFPCPYVRDVPLPPGVPVRSPVTFLTSMFILGQWGWGSRRDTSDRGTQGPYDGQYRCTGELLKLEGESGLPSGTICDSYDSKEENPSVIHINSKEGTPVCVTRLEDHCRSRCGSYRSGVSCGSWTVTGPSRGVGVCHVTEGFWTTVGNESDLGVGPPDGDT